MRGGRRGAFGVRETPTYLTPYLWVLSLRAGGRSESRIDLFVTARYTYKDLCDMRRPTSEEASARRR